MVVVDIKFVNQITRGKTYNHDQYETDIQQDGPVFNQSILVLDCFDLTFSSPYIVYQQFIAHEGIEQVKQCKDQKEDFSNSNFIVSRNKIFWDKNDNKKGRSNKMKDVV